jgi:Flp pilus assembly protein TadD
VLARRGEHEAAEHLVREAVALVDPTDQLEGKAIAYTDLAIVLAAAGKRDEALDALGEAQTFYAEKGHVPGLAAVEELRSELVGTLGA